VSTVAASVTDGKGPLAHLAPSQREAITLLADLLRIDTTNPPGNELLAAEMVESRLHKEGIAATLIESQPGRASLVARLKGDGTGGGPLLLNAHLDVVPAGDPARWTHPPFDGTIADGYVWGRGAVDMKHMAALSTQVLIEVQRSGARLTRDLVLTLVADEEEGCEQGSRYLVDHHREKVQAEYVLGEVGGFTLHLLGSRFYPIMIAEKGIAWLRLRAQGDPGHGSMPNPDSAIIRLARAIARVGGSRLPQHNTETVTRFLEAVAAHLGKPKGLVLRALLNHRLSGPILRNAVRDPALSRPFFAALSNTASPTALSAGGKHNVIPGEATALIDGRTLPGQSTADLIAELKAVLGHDGDHLRFEVVREFPPTVSSHQTPLFELLCRTVEKHDPGAVAVPYMAPGFTDAQAFSRMGARCYGFAPVQLPAGLSFSKLFHGDDERVPVDGLAWGLKVLDEVVRSFCVSGQR
jgi:acetylornithine deacetylase/succinyl-diaminopimelate desuccinylase-like protein